MTAWKFGNYDLSSFGAVTLIEDYMDMPEARGENITIPFRHGTIFVPKYFDERTILFGITTLTSSIEECEAILDTLRSLVALRTQQTLYQHRLDGTIRTALASVDRPLNVTRPAPHLAKLTIEFVLAEPFFRLSTLIADNTTVINASPKAMIVTNPGSIEERDPIITLTGPLLNTSIVNATNSCSLTYTGTIAGGASVEIRTTNGEYTAIHSGSGNVIDNISHSGDSALLPLESGVNTLSITDGTATTGTVKISFYAPYL